MMPNLERGAPVGSPVKFVRAAEHTRPLRILGATRVPRADEAVAASDAEVERWWDTVARKKRRVLEPVAKPPPGTTTTAPASHTRPCDVTPLSDGGGPLAIPAPPSDLSSGMSTCLEITPPAPTIGKRPALPPLATQATEFLAWLRMSQVEHLECEEKAEREAIASIEHDVRWVWIERLWQVVSLEGHEDAKRGSLEIQQHWAFRLLCNVSYRQLLALQLVERSWRTVVQRWWGRLEAYRRHRQRSRHARKMGDVLAASVDKLLYAKYWNTWYEVMPVRRALRKERLFLLNQEYASRSMIKNEEIDCANHLQAKIHHLDLVEWVLRRRMAHLPLEEEATRQALESTVETEVEELKSRE
eukprot:Sspe_Gene.93440::Locus_66079_Transcript_3_3_Confidence_0.571_Length_1120::g.93440::m.93440